MTPASIDDLKKELKQLPPGKMLELLLKLARFKKENKELLTYLLFESGDEEGYVDSLKNEMDEMFADIEKAPSTTVKKQLRKITRLITRQSKYISSKATACELHVHFCQSLRDHPANLLSITSAHAIYHQQLNRIAKLVPALEDDLQHDYGQKLALLRDIKVPAKRTFKIFRRM